MALQKTIKSRTRQITKKNVSTTYPHYQMLSLRSVQRSMLHSREQSNFYADSRRLITDETSTHGSIQHQKVSVVAFISCIALFKRKREQDNNKSELKPTRSYVNARHDDKPVYAPLKLRTKRPSEFVWKISKKTPRREILFCCCFCFSP